jgi:hypothetical protein
MSSIGIGAKREVWTRGPHRLLDGKRRSLVMGIKFKVYPIEGDIHVFQALSIVQKHGDEKNLRDKLLLADLENSSGSECVNSW